MKHINFNISGGYPLVQESFAFMQKSYTDGFFALAKSFSDLRPNAALVLTGCTPSINGSVISLTEGFIVWSDGEILHVPAASLTYNPNGTLYFLPTEIPDSILDPTYYAISSQVQDVHISREAVLSYTNGTGSLPYLEQNRLSSMLFVNDFDVWHTVGNSGEPAFNTGYSAGSSPVQFLKNKFGEVVVRGRATFNSPTTPTIFQLPIGYRPPYKITLPFVLSFGTGGFSSEIMEINTNGDVTNLYTGASSNTNNFLDLSSIRFYL